MKQTAVDLGEEVTVFEKHSTPASLTPTPGAALCWVLSLQTAGVLLPCAWWTIHYPSHSDYISFTPLVLAYTAAFLALLVTFHYQIKDSRTTPEQLQSVITFRLVLFLLPSGLNMLFSFLCSNYFPPYFQTGMHFHVMMYLTCDLLFSVNWTMMPYVRHSLLLRSVYAPFDISGMILGWMLFSFSLVGIFRHLSLANFAMSMWCVIHVVFDTGAIAAIGLTIEEKAKTSVPLNRKGTIFVVILCMLISLAVMLWSTGRVFRMIYGDVVNVSSNVKQT